ncbi:MAG TPA: hypothetical protein VET65_03425 [Candidatus Limnocylindrales bacterium]|nr:hypothetical protein [Candidatus Limnocylindrales bacterium]
MHRGHLAGSVLAGAGALLLAACGSSASGTAASPSAQNTIVRTATKTVAGQAQVVLTDRSGLTLYWFKPDTATSVACTGGCAAAWPPLTAPAGALAAPAGVFGTLTTLDGPNGHQIVYNGHPLYTFSKDKASSDVLGQGIGGLWFVATPTLAKAAASVGTAVGGGRYGAQVSASP